MHASNNPSRLLVRVVWMLQFPFPGQDPNIQIDVVCVDATFEDCQAAGGLYGNGEYRGAYEWIDDLASGGNGDGVAQPNEIFPAQNDFLAFTCTDSAADRALQKNQIVYDDSFARGGGVDPTVQDNYPITNPGGSNPIGNIGGLSFDDPNGFHGGFDILRTPFPADVDDDSFNERSALAA